MMFINSGAPAMSRNDGIRERKRLVRGACRLDESLGVSNMIARRITILEFIYYLGRFAIWSIVASRGRVLSEIYYVVEVTSLVENAVP